MEIYNETKKRVTEHFSKGHLTFIESIENLPKTKKDISYPVYDINSKQIGYALPTVHFINGLSFFSFYKKLYGKTYYDKKGREIPKVELFYKGYDPDIILSGKTDITFKDR